MPVSDDWLRTAQTKTPVGRGNNGAPPSPGVIEREQRRKREDEALARSMGLQLRYDDERSWR